MVAPALAAGAYASAAQRFAGAGASPALKPPAGAAGTQDSFANLLSQVVGSVADTARAADTAAVKSTAGRSDMVDVVTAVAESETAMQTLISVRDRVLAAYDEIMRMNI